MISVGVQDFLRRVARFSLWSLLPIFKAWNRVRFASVFGTSHAKLQLR